jgi:hypothetical protein
VAVGEWIKPQAPALHPVTYAAPKGDVQQARHIVEAALKQWAALALAWAPPIKGEDNPARCPVEALRVSTGVGKSHAARVQAVAMVKDLRARGDDRCVGIAVPRHDLADEFVKKLRAQGVSVEAWKGRKQPDPRQPGLSMCPRPKDADAAQNAGVDVGGTLCRSGKEHCPFLKTCGYQEMKMRRPDVWIVTHAMLWNAPPEAIKPAVLIVDEDPTGDVYGGCDGPPYRLSLDDLRGPLPVLAGKDPEKTADLAAVTAKLASVLDASNGKVLTRDIRAAFGPDLARIEALRNVPYMARNIRPATPLNTGADLADRLVQAGPVNARAAKTARLLGIVADALRAGLDTAPELTVKIARTPEGDGYKVARMKWRKHLHKGWNLPTMVMSATLQAPLLRHVWPQLSEVTTAEAAMPHVQIRQITRPCGQSASSDGLRLFEQS